MSDSSQSPANERDDRLDSWKQIAGFLGTTDRTVQRWEREEGLPVHRHLHRKKSSVHAFKSELQDWVASRVELGRLPKGEDQPEDPPAQNDVRDPQPPLPRRLPRIKVMVSLLAFAGVVLAAFVIPRRVSPPSGAVPAGRLLADLTREGSRARAIPVGGIPTRSILTPDEQELYVALQIGETKGAVSVIDTRNAKVTHHLEVGGMPVGLVVSPNGRRAYVANRVGNIQVIDTTTKTWRTVNVGGPTWDVALSPDGRRLYVTMAYQGLKRIMTDTEIVETV